MRQKRVTRPKLHQNVISAHAPLSRGPLVGLILSFFLVLCTQPI